MLYTNMRDFIQAVMNGMGDDGHLQVDVVSGAANVDISDADVQAIADAISAAIAGMSVDISADDITGIATAIAAQQLTALGYGWDYSAATPVWRKINVDSSGDIQTDVLSTVHPTSLTTVATGERAGSATAVQLATVTAKYVRFKARMANTGAVWVGNSNAVTKGAGTTTTTCGFPLWAGEDSGWLPASNLNLFWIICDNASDHLTYMVIV